MGLFSAGNSKSNTNNYSSSAGYSDINDNAAVTSVQGISVGEKGTANISVTDNGATKSAFEFANKQSSQAYDFSRDITQDVIGKTSAQISTAIQAVSESARTETENILISLQKYALYGAIIWGAVMIFRTVK